MVTSSIPGIFKSNERLFRVASEGNLRFDENELSKLSKFGEKVAWCLSSMARKA